MDRLHQMAPRCTSGQRTRQLTQIRDSLEFPEFLVVKKYYPRLYFNTDKLGRPVYIERLGQVDIAKLLQVTTNERMLQYTIYMYEKLTNYILPGCSIAAGKNIEQTLTILDLSGIYLSSFPSVFTLLSDISNVAQNYYPETLGKMFIINAPMLFYGVWALISPLLNEVTVKKISILGSSYKTELLEYIENENLPDFLGGTCTSNNWENVDVGPWKNTDLANEKWERLNRAYGI